MSDSKVSSSSGGIGLAVPLFITFLVLKLCKVIDWSWWWITAPLWGTVALVLLFFGCVLAFVHVVAGTMFVVAWFSELFRKPRK